MKEQHVDIQYSTDEKTPEFLSTSICEKITNRLTSFGSMFIEFQIGNFRSFRDIQKFTMLAAPKRSNDSGLNEDNVVERDGLRSLKTKAIYGANASGKSNLLRAIAAFRTLVFRSVSEEELPTKTWDNRFQLITDWEEQPVFFQYIFSVNETIYRYGFQILQNRIIYEWLYKGERADETRLFFREEGHVDIHPTEFPTTELFTDQIKDNTSELFRADTLFLTVAALYNNKFAAELRAEIMKIYVVDGISDGESLAFAMSTLEAGSDNDKAALVGLLKAADTGVEDIELQPPSETVERYALRKRLLSVHSRYDENGKLVDQITVPFIDWESQGTAKLLGIGSLVLRCLELGGVLVIDEFDARFHPNLTLKIVDLFNHEKTNPKHAQLIIATHDTGLLRRADFRRDQICLVNKDRFGISEINTLIEYKGIRKDSSFEKEYLNGSYSAVPYLDELDRIILQQARHD
ncbi:MAG: hypothetical protein DI535_00735 [Citrobacter freundii]|nr:MAG: hypothetical protein DI535_00735 [Citrobacter freundii]